MGAGAAVRTSVYAVTLCRVVLRRLRGVFVELIAAPRQGRNGSTVQYVRSACALEEARRGEASKTLLHFVLGAARSVPGCPPKRV